MLNSPKPTKPTKEGVYLYSLWNGRLMVYEGDIYEDVRGGGTFVSKTKRFGCSLDREVVYNAIVWLEEHDEQLAKHILIEYEINQIARLQEKIDNHLHKIRILKGEKI